MNPTERPLSLGVPRDPLVQVTLEWQPAGWRVAIHHLPTDRARVYGRLPDLEAVADAVHTTVIALLETG